MIQEIAVGIVIAIFIASIVFFVNAEPTNAAIEVAIQVPTWQIETEIFDDEMLTGVVLRNTDKRDVAGAGGQLIISGDADTIELLLNELGVE